MKIFSSPIFLLGQRLLLSKKSGSFLSFISWVSVIGVGLGVMSLTLVTSVINGFEGEISRVITDMNGDIILYSRNEPIRDPELIEAEIRRVVPEVQTVASSFVMELMVSADDGISGALLQGFDIEKLGQVTAIPRRVQEGRMPLSAGEVAVGVDLAQKLNLKIGSSFRLVTPFVGENQGPPRAVRVEVVGIIRMGMFEYDSKFIFMPLVEVQKFLDQKDQVTHFNIKLQPGSFSKRASDRLSSRFGYPFQSKDWSQLNRNLFSAIQLEKAVIAIIMTVIIIVAAFNVVSTLMMMIHDKAKEIAILKAMGLRPSQAFWLFCNIGLGIGAVGILIGVGAGLGLGWILARTHLIELPADIYYIHFLPVVVKPVEVFLIAGIAWVICFLATLYPAWRVSRQSPLEGLRYES